MNDFNGEGLFILAAIVIAFVNWLSNTLKQRAAKREIERRRAKGELVEPRQVEHVEDEGWPQPDEPVTPHEEANARLRAFFDSLAPQETPPPPPPETTSSRERERVTQERERVAKERAAAQQVVADPLSKPSARWQAPKVRKPKFSAEEKRALKRLEARSSPATSTATREHPLIQELLKRGGARDAIIFAEILGKPKALAEQESP